MLLWTLRLEGQRRLVTTAEQAGTTAMRRVFEEMGYKFKYIVKRPTAARCRRNRRLLTAAAPQNPAFSRVDRSATAI